MLALLSLLAAVVVPGHDVLVTGSHAMHAYLDVRPAAHGAARFEMWETADGAPVRTYDLNMTKRAHMVLVSDDLRDFHHLHPALRADGRFVITFAPPQRGLYHIYLDADPHAIGRQVFRFDVPIGSARAATTRAAPHAGNVAHAGPYTVRLDTTTVASAQIATLRVDIRKNGAPATDLHPYLGAMAHGVFVGMNDLAYMHGHGMDLAGLAMAANDCGDAMMAASPPLATNAPVPSAFVLQVLAPRPQRYVFWLQFTGGRTLYTVPFVVSAT